MFMGRKLKYVLEKQVLVTWIELSLCAQILYRNIVIMVWIFRIYDCTDGFHFNLYTVFFHEDCATSKAGTKVPHFPSSLL
jgi:hypothetical protein